MIITLTNGAAAFLKRKNEYLLMKRALNRKVAPNMWSSVGGHMENNEINAPQTACLRKIFEETGITAEQMAILSRVAVWYMRTSSYFAVTIYPNIKE